MITQVHVSFDPPTPEDWQAMEALARHLTQDPTSIHVCNGDVPGWLVAEFSMPTQAQYRAVSKIGSALDLYVWERLDVSICFDRRVRALAG